jgi:hypothetical protein
MALRPSHRPTTMGGMRALLLVLVWMLPAIVHADQARVRLIRTGRSVAEHDVTTIGATVTAGQLSIDVRHWVEGCAGARPSAPRFDVVISGDRVRIARRGAAAVPDCEAESDAICSSDMLGTHPCAQATCACEYRIMATIPATGIRRVEVGDDAGTRARRAVGPSRF